MTKLNKDITKKDSGEKISLINFIDEAINELKFGELKLTIHDSKIVQIEKAEKFRFL